MSKSNNNLYTPEQLGEQKGEHSPFFHTPSTEELKKILLESQNNLSFSDEDSIRELSTFFHADTRNKFINGAQKRAAERADLAGHVADLTQELAKAVFHLASIISPPREREKDLLSSCASRALCISEFLSDIDTNILFFIHKTTLSEVDYNIFFQVEKSLFFVEQVENHLNITPQNSDIRRRLLLAHPPITMTKHIASASENYARAKQFLKQALIDSTKAAKQENFEKYNNILHNTAVHLHDIARILEAAAKDLQSKDSSAYI